MKKLLISAIALLLTLTAPAQWKAYLSYHEPQEIEQAGRTLYVLASGGLYAYNQDEHSLQTYDKTTVLSDCGISHIAWCQTARKLVIVYDDHNIDLLSPNDNVENLANYQNASMTADKTVYSVDIAGTDAYLSTGFGIVRLNVRDAEFRNTYQLGFRVDYSYVEGGYLYAASSTNGLYRGRLTDNLLNPASWTRVGSYTARPKTIDPDLLAVVSTLNPGGPPNNGFSVMKLHNGKLYATASNDDFTEHDGTLKVYDGSQWLSNSEYISQLSNLNFSLIYDLDIDPRDENHLFVGCRSGVYEFNNLRFTRVWNNDNSPMQTAATVGNNNRNYVVVTGLKFDTNNSLWVLNSISPSTSILEMSPTGEWTSHHKPALIVPNISPQRSLEGMRSPIFDSRGLLWFVNDFYRTPALVCYQPSTDALNVYTQFINEDGTDVGVLYVRYVAEDRNGNLWIGTDKGPLLLEPGQITADIPVFNQVKVPRNDGTNYADYLLSGVDISCIAIDRGNRKWFGTHGNGLYLISADNITQLGHFTKENSPLLSNEIASLAIDDATGELFIGTDNGLCSYTTQSRNNGEGMTKDNVWAYPNPVRPDYKGAITITGLDENADVKIVTANGALVSEGRATGGQFRWYGINRDGKRVASGVYMVEVATSEGEKGVVCKIAIVN